MNFIASLFSTALGSFGGAIGGWLARIGLAAIVAGGLLTTGYLKGQAAARAKSAAAQRDIALAYAGEIVARQQTADGLATELAALRAAGAEKARLVTKEITRYVQVTPANRRCILPGTWRLRHDAAALGHLPEGSAAGPLADATAEPVEDATALETIGDNYATCHDAIAKLEGWQRRQRALSGTGQ